MTRASHPLTYRRPVWFWTALGWVLSGPLNVLGVGMVMWSLIDPDAGGSFDLERIGVFLIGAPSAVGMAIALALAASGPSPFSLGRIAGVTLFSAILVVAAVAIAFTVIAVMESPNGALGVFAVTLWVGGGLALASVTTAIPTWRLVTFRRIAP